MTELSTTTRIQAPAHHISAPAGAKGSGGSVSHVLPISSLRFILAMWVVFGHIGTPFFSQKPQHIGLIWVARVLLGNFFNGPAAVIIFFVISGFCIHFPNRYGLAVNSWKMYYARRYLRILIPMTAAIALSLPLHMQLGILTDSILWSLLCEEVYYLLYPALLVARDRIGWRNLLAVTYVLAYLVVLTKPHELSYPSYGPALNWVLGLPCWLLGCKLAENFDTLNPASVSRAQIWWWRGGALFLSVMLRALDFHSPLRSPWTLNLFAIYGFFWLAWEIRYYRDHRRKPAFEDLGEASYSIYLTHLHGPMVLAMLPIAASLSIYVRWCWTMTLCVVFAVTFYWVVERPSHRFARYYARRAAWLQA